MPLTATTLFAAGYQDIIPVLPPHAPLSPFSRIAPASRGKVPGRKTPRGDWVGFGDWRKHEASAADAAAWDVDGANIGLRADRFPAVDVDCTDPLLAAFIIERARQLLGAAPCRVGNAPKALLLYRTDQPFGRTRLRLRRGGEQHLIEILGAGQQFVAAGIHPKTGRPYEWDRNPAECGPGALTVIDRDKVLAFLGRLTEELTASGFSCSRDGSGAPDRAERPGVAQEALRAPNLEALAAAVAAIPNTDEEFPDRDDYIRMGYAIKAAAQEDEAAGFKIFLGWALRWDGGMNAPATVRADWARMRPPFDIGWHWSAAQARQHGFNDAALYFDAVAGAAAPDAAPQLPPAVRYTEDDLADRFLADHGAILRSVPAWKAWLVWDGTRWRRDESRAAQALARETNRRAADRVIRDASVKNAASLAASLSSANRVSSVLALAGSDRRVIVAPDQLDADPWLLNTPGGVVDLRTGLVRPHDPTLLLTKRTAAALERGADCGRWQGFLLEATGGDPALVRYLQRLAGYCLTGSVDEHVIAFVHGSGGNGKSVFLNTLNYVLGDYATQAPMSTFVAGKLERHPTEVAALRGARLVTASETGEGGRWDEARLKSLSAGDPVTARFLYGDFFTFQPQGKLLLVGNHKPSLRNVDEAMRRRLHLVPFTVKPAAPDPQLAEKLRAEAPAILSWMVDGCLAWQAQGLAAPEVVRAATEEYFTDEDALGRWLEEECELSVNEATTTEELYAAWHEWCGRTGEFVGSPRRFSQMLVNRGFPRWRHPRSRKYGFRGIAPRPAATAFAGGGA